MTEGGRDPLVFCQSCSSPGSQGFISQWQPLVKALGWCSHSNLNPSIPLGGGGLLTSGITWPRLWATTFGLLLRRRMQTRRGGGGVLHVAVLWLSWLFAVPAERRVSLCELRLWALVLMHSCVFCFSPVGPTLTLHYITLHSCVLCRYVWNLCHLSFIVLFLCLIAWDRFKVLHFKTQLMVECTILGSVYPECVSYFEKFWRKIFVLHEITAAALSWYYCCFI